MTIKVTQSTSSYSVKIQAPIKFNVQVTGEAGSVAGSLTDLDDFDPSGVQNNYIVMYNAATQKYVTVDPDVVLSSAVTTNNGLPQDFIDKLDVDLDNKIDLDAGTF
jgi:predicted amino acid dehydrogenase